MRNISHKLVRMPATVLMLNGQLIFTLEESKVSLSTLELGGVSSSQKDQRSERNLNATAKVNYEEPTSL